MVPAGAISVRLEGRVGARVLEGGG
eukprot:COSAG02_NODE_27023_length_618_cov_1.583815_1_plen_24_part_10